MDENMNQVVEKTVEAVSKNGGLSTQEKWIIIGTHTAAFVVGALVINPVKRLVARATNTFKAKKAVKAAESEVLEAEQK